MNERFIIVNITRDGGSVSRYQVEYEDHLTIARILAKIYTGQDRTLAYRHYCCNIARCVSCMVKVDGKSVHACKHVVEAGTEIRLEAASEGRTIRDLVIDFGSKRHEATLVRIVQV